MITRSPLTYEFRVVGHLDDDWSAWFGLLIARHDDGTSTLTGPVTDQAQLHGILARLRDMGATLLALRTVAGNDPDAGNARVTEKTWAPGRKAGR